MSAESIAKALGPPPDQSEELVEQFMSVHPYASAQRVFVIVDNGSAHRGKRSIDRLQGAWPNLILVHTPIHASWLNQAEIYFSVVQRKVLQPNDFQDLDILEGSLLAFGRRYEQIAKPFQWKFTRQDLDKFPPKQYNRKPADLRGFLKRMKGLEPSTCCMASASGRSIPFAPVRSNPLFARVPAQASERNRTRANVEPCHPCHGVRR